MTFHEQFVLFLPEKIEDASREIYLNEPIRSMYYLDLGRARQQYGIFCSRYPQGKSVGASQNVGCFLRLSLFLILIA